MSSPDRTQVLLDQALEDYLSRLDQGEEPDIQEYLERYPDCAEELERFFRDFEYVDARIAAEQRSALQSAAGESIASTGSATSAPGEREAWPAAIPRMKRFELIEELGSGSQGVVFKARQLGTKRLVALKVIREGAFASRAERRRFESEVELASSLSHRNIVAVYECGQDAGRDYYAMEYIEGDPLDVYLDAHPSDPRATVELFLQICDAVVYTHQHGVIHRDLKPTNVLVNSSGRARIVDFGLAKPIPAGSSLVPANVTEPGAFAGTWYYASPEQARRDPALVDVRSDVYSLGVILYEMLTDVYPYPIQGETREAIARHILETPPQRPSTIRRDVDDDLETVILRTLRKEPERRYQSVAALGEDLRRCLSGEAIEAKRDSSWYVLRKALRRYRWRVTAATVVLVALAAFAVTVSILYRQALTARATIEVRTDIVRRGQAYLTDKLDELHWASNQLNGIAEAHPELPEVRRLRRTPREFPASLFKSIVAGMPEGLIEIVQSRGHPEYAAAVAWLDEHEAELADLEAMTHTHRLVFSVSRLPHSNLAVTVGPGDSGYAVPVAEAMIARALRAYGKSRHEAAVANLEAAGSIAQDLADGRLMQHKTEALHIRAQTYEAVGLVLNASGPERGDFTPYADWILRDPPLPQLRLALIDARQRTSQLLEGGSSGSTPGGDGYVDLDILDALSGGFYDEAGALTDAHRTVARRTTPAEALAVNDLLVGELENWDQVSHRDFQMRAEKLSRTLKNLPAYQVVQPIAGHYHRTFELRGHLRTRRAALVLATYLLRYRADQGRWPDSLSEALPDGARVGIRDPFIDEPFGYLLVDGRPVLYSFNEDGQDHGGKDGNWGEAGTDVVFFHPSAKSRLP